MIRDNAKSTCCICEPDTPGNRTGSQKRFGQVSTFFDKEGGIK